jgi:hypothetical protein
MGRAANRNRKNGLCARMGIDEKSMLFTVDKMQRSFREKIKELPYK